MPTQAFPELHKLGLALSRRIFDRLDELSTHDFPTKTPILLSDIIRRIVAAVISSLETSSDERTSKYAVQSLKIIATHLKYIESASTARIPTSLITPLETVIKRSHPDAQVMLRVQSSYNYTVANIIETYRKMFAQLLPEFDSLLDGTTHLYLVGVPGVEDCNILLHALLAHELGHRVADKYLASEDQTKILKAIETLIGTDLTWYTADFLSLPQQHQLPLRQKIFSLVIEARRRAIQELISDAVGYHLVGISMLFAADELTASLPLDAPPAEKSRWYPPWRYRIRTLEAFVSSDSYSTVIRTIDGQEPLKQIRDSALRFLDRMKEIANQDLDTKLIQADGIVSRAYNDIPSVMEHVPSFIAAEMSGLKFETTSLKTELVPLLERLSAGIPPDEVAGTTADFRSSLTAGWLYRLTRISVPFLSTKPWSPEHDDILNRLVLKAMESIELLREYRKRGETDK